MKGRRWIALLAGILLLAGSALADGEGNGGATLIGGSEYSGTTSFRTVSPYAWTVQNSENIFYRAMDNNINTVYSYTAWSSKAQDDIPEVTFDFNGAMIQDIWIRNGNQTSEEAYFGNARTRRINVDIYSDAGVSRYEYRMTDLYDPWSYSTEWSGGYQRLHLPRAQRGVTRVDFWILGWYRGNESTYNMSITDILFAGENTGASAGIGTAASTEWGDPGWDTGIGSAASVGVGSAASTGIGTGASTTGGSTYPGTGAVYGTSAGISVRLNQRMATCSGPGTQYTELGSYFEAGTVVRAISAAYDGRNGIWWIQTEFTYMGVPRRAYTGIKRLDMTTSQVPSESLIWSGVQVSTTSSVFWGPGYQYTQYEFQVPAGTVGDVYQVEGNFAQLEYYDGSGKLRRVWIPVDALSVVFG